MFLYPKAAVPFLREKPLKVGLKPTMVGVSPLLEIDQIAKGAGGPEHVAEFPRAGRRRFGREMHKSAQWKAKVEKRFGDHFNLYHLPRRRRGSLPSRRSVARDRDQSAERS